MEDPLKILGLKPGDTLKIAHKRRNALFLRIHPDKSPTDKEMYQKVYNAYETLKEHPEMLSIKKVFIGKPDQILRVKLNVTIEDFYFKRIKTITINRGVFCISCGGSGSNSGIDGKCSYCKGSGKIESSILSLLGKGPDCPMCRGTGIDSNNLCHTCNGYRYIQETRSINFTLSPINYHKKVAVLSNVGNQIDAIHYGSVVVVLNILQDNAVNIEDNYFVVYDHILPIQKIIGDNKTIDIFGRAVTYKIKENSTDAYTIDKISPDLQQEIRIKFIDTIPKFTRETIALYKKILEIEKKYDSYVSTIQF